MNRHSRVDAHMQDLENPHKELGEQTGVIIQGADLRVDEGIKLGRVR